MSAYLPAITGRGGHRAPSGFRFGPSCQAKRSAVFAEWVTEHVLLDEAHRHVVFTVPRPLRA